MHNLAVAAVRRRDWAGARYWIGQAREVDPDDASLRRLRLKLRMHAGAEAASWLLAQARRLGRAVGRTRPRPSPAPAGDAGLPPGNPGAG